MVPSRKRGFPITPEGLALIEQKMRQKGITSLEALALLANLNPTTISKKLFKGGKFARPSINEIAEALDIEPTQIVEPERRKTFWPH
jgi:lambda repressor-like predicted transcriptional regulator